MAVRRFKANGVWVHFDTKKKSKKKKHHRKRMPPRVKKGPNKGQFRKRR